MNRQLPQFVKTQQKHEGLLLKLVQFQLRGSWKRHKYARATRLLERIPRRLGFRLQDLVSQELLQAGTVFLGFLANSQFVLSYTVHFEEDDMVGLPAYKYRLQWWVFVPCRPLVKVSETTLFGDHKINAELVLAVCQWPTDESKILIYGCSLHEDLRCDHYMTVAGTPPLRPCVECSCLHLRSDNSSSPQKQCCIRHGFVLHMSCQLEGPYLSFVPVLALKCDGVLLLNVGDALVSLHINVTEPQKRPECSATGSDTSTGHPDSTKGSPLHASAEALFDSLLEKRLETKGSGHSSVQGPGAQLSSNKVCNTQHSPSEPHALKELGDEREFHDSTTSPAPLDISGLNNSMVSHHLCGSRAFVESQELDKAPHVVEPCMSLEAQDVKEPSPAVSEVSTRRYSRAERLFDALLREHLRSRDKGNVGKTTRGRPLRRSADVDSLHDGSVIGSDQTPCRGDDGPSASLDVGNCLGGCVSTTRLFFAQGPDAAEEETCSSYLPLEVHGTGYRLLKPRPSASSTTGTTLEIREIKFDMEVFADTVARKLCSEEQKVYCAFEDYDVRIAEVCPEDRTALLLFCVLVRAADPEGMDGHCGVGRATYRAGALLQWNLDTGHYVIIRMDNLEEWERSEELGSWKCNHQKVKQARKDCRLPPPHPARNVTVFTNSPVVQGTSLTALWAPGHYFAITL